MLLLNTIIFSLIGHFKISVPPNVDHFLASWRVIVNVAMLKSQITIKDICVYVYAIFFPAVFDVFSEIMLRFSVL